MAQDATEPLLVHGTCVAFANGGILLRGAPGSGKSDLALRFIAAYGNGRTDGGGAALVSDDQVQLTRVDDAIVARAPEQIAGKLEVRGVGIITLDHVPFAELSLLVDLRRADEIERLPPASLPREDVLGVSLPLASLDPTENSAPVKLKLMVTGKI